MTRVKVFGDVKECFRGVLTKAKDVDAMREGRGDIVDKTCNVRSDIIEALVILSALLSV